jgi:transcriptional regulator with XRE-family HTH domain
MKSLNEKLKALRKANRYSQSYVAEYLGIDTTSYGRIERGDRKITTDRLELLARLYKSSPKELLDLDTSKKNLVETPSTDDEFLNYLKGENLFLRNSLLSKDKQLDILIEINKEYKKVLNGNKKAPK